MTVLLVITTIVIFLLVDFVRSRKAVTRQVAETAPEMQHVPRVPSDYVAGFQLPLNLQYHPGHTWALRESPTLVRVGFDDFAAKLLGRVENLLLPKRGQWIRQGQKIFRIERNGAEVELVSPIEGEITGVNDAVAKDPSVIGGEPYGRGWLLTVTAPDAETCLRNLLNGNLARKWMTDTAERLRAKMPALAGAVAQDGGVAVHDLSEHLPDEEWGALAREFFLT